MTILHSYKSVLTAALLLSGSLSFAQGGGAPVDPTLSGTATAPVNKDWRPSLTPDGAFDHVNPTQRIRKPIPWQHIRESDIMWKKRVWREIDIREKQNIAFRYTGDEQTGGGMFIEILIDAVKKGKVQAYNTFDDRFTQVLTKEQLMEQITGKPDTVTVVDDVSGEEKVMIRTSDFRPESITKYRLKEDWIFDRNQGQMVVRITGLAPVRDLLNEDGSYKGPQPMFWLYYPDIREVLAQYEVFNPQNDMARYTWEEFFESRQFSSKITKVSNPFDQDYRNMNLSPMESLYEGRRAAEEIFNKEHDMWVY